MSSDTERALEIIKPMAKELRITVTADDSFLYCNGQAIGIGFNSTYATIKEFIGYVFATVYKHDVFDMHNDIIPQEVLDRVKGFWITEEQLQLRREAQ